MRIRQSQYRIRSCFPFGVEVVVGRIEFSLGPASKKQFV